MRKIIITISCVLFFACDSEKANDCFQNTGDIVQQEISVDAFDKILVNRDIELIIKEGAEQKVVVQTGENLMNDVLVEVIGGRLVLTDNNTCNYVRDYGLTKVYVTAANLVEIRSSTQYDVSSDGILTFPSLTILSEDFNMPEAYTVGDFRLKINNETLSVTFNNLSIAHIEGQTNNLNITFSNGNCRFEGRGLIAQKVNIWNRSSNDMIVNPQQEIKGKILGLGNVISINEPPLVNVEEVYRGQLIFE
ncbi:head GIN domain-containing protein [Tamlana flava]|uniref:head GIN domain-containing protein n=1 Tax=Tamlana flava TaxID=3158572 RepID=UPI00351BEBD9